MSVNVFAGQDDLAAPNDPLAGVDDFTEWFGLTAPTVDDTNRIHTALEIASAEIRNNRRIFTLTENEIVLVDGSLAETLLLPKNRLPVTGVTLVEELSGTDYVTLDADSYDWSPDGYLIRRSLSCWTPRPLGVRVTYSHGYDPIPRDVAGVCLSLAGRLYTNPDNASIQSEQLGDHHVTYTGATGGLSPAEEAVLRMYESIA